MVASGYYGVLNGTYSSLGNAVQSKYCTLSNSCFAHIPGYTNSQGPRRKPSSIDRLYFTLHTRDGTSSARTLVKTFPTLSAMAD